MAEDFDFSKHRTTMRDKAKRLASGGDPHEKTDASSWTPSEPLNAGAKTGMRPISRRAYKKGGKVEGEREKQRADRKPRKDGGKAIADAYINRDQKEANEERPGVKHVGGFKRGGRAEHSFGGTAAKLPMGKFKLSQAREHADATAHMLSTGKAPARQQPANERKNGGRTKKADGGSFVPTERMAFNSGPSQMSKAAGYKSGGHPDEKEDRKLVKTMVKKPALTGRKEGGKVDVLDGGHVDGGRLAHAAGGDVSAPIGYHILDRSGSVVGKTKNSRMASTMVDRRDNAYGAAIHRRQPIYHEGDWGAKHRSDYQARKDGGEIDRTERKHGGRADAHWIKGALAGGHKGALHKELNVADDKRIPQKKLEKAEHSSNKMVAKRAHLAETLEHMNKPEKADGGRMARAEGGRTKGKTNINIVIAQPSRDEGSPPDQGPQMGPPPPMPPRPPMPPPAQLGGTPLPPPTPPQGGGGPPPMGMPPGMPRKDGGRTVKVAHDMAEEGGGAGSGLGRLEKIRSYGHRA